LAILLAVAAGACSASVSDAASQAREAAEQRGEQAMMIRITAGERILIAKLEDSAAGRDFAALLPLDLTLSDYNRTEKIADLPRRLSIEGAPDGIDPAIGDIAYYAPWGNLAIFYSDFGYSRGLVRLGRLDGGAERLAKLEGPVRIEILAP
jgi:hypothetical protein